jgi:hypothetical protein
MLNTLFPQHLQLLPLRHRLRAGVDIELGVDVVNVPLHSAGCPKKLAGNFRVEYDIDTSPKTSSKIKTNLANQRASLYLYTD